MKLSLWLLAGVLLLALTTGAFAASTESSPTPRPDWCHQGWQCLPTAELAEATEEIWLLRAENESLRFKARHAIGRVWGQIGVEYLPNDAQYEGYATVGVNVGRVGLWGGFYGDSPVVGVGWGF